MSTKIHSFMLGPGEGPTLGAPIGGGIDFKVRGEQSEGRFTAFESTPPPGEGPPLHTHANEDEIIYVLDGDFRFKLGEEIAPASAGSFVYIRQGEPHTWQNVGESPGRMLVIFTPTGMERFFDAFAAVEDPGPESFATAAKEAAMDVVGPPLAQSDPL